MPDNDAMTVRDIVAPRAVHVPLLLAGTFLCAVTSVLLAPEGSPVAAWWPAAGLSVALLLVSPRRSWWWLTLAVAGVSALANYAGGRAVETALCFGVANAVEAAVVFYWLIRGTPERPSLRTRDGLSRLFAGTAIGVLVIGVLAGLTVALVEGGDFFHAFRAVLASHAASLLVIVPLALVADVPRPPDRRREKAAQWACLVASVGVVFAPGQAVALAFLPMPVLTWGAVRFGPRTVSHQLLFTGVAATAMSVHGWGPFAATLARSAGSGALTATLVQVFLIACALTVLPLTVAVEHRREALTQVSESEELFRRSFTDSVVGMVLLRWTGGTLQIVEANSTAAEILGVQPAALEGLDWAAMLTMSPPVAETVQAMLAEDRQGWRCETDLAADARRRVGVSLSRLTGQSGDPMFTAQMVDITAAHEANHRLRTEKDFTSAIIDTTGCLIVVVGVDGTVVGMNPAAQTVSGFTEQEVMGRPIWETLVPPADRDAVRETYAAPMGLSIPLTNEADLATRKGGRRRVVWSSAFLKDERGRRGHLVMTGIDVTAERTTASLMSHLMRAASTTAFIGTDLEGRITAFNSGAEQMLGYAAREMVGRHLPVELFDPDEVAERARERGATADLTVLTHRIASGGGPESLDWTIARKDRSSFVASITVSPVTDTFGRHIGYLAVGNDVTEQRRSENLLVAALEKEREAVNRLRQLDQAKSDFVSTVSHELRTPITSISGYTEMLQDGAAGELTPGQHKLIDAVRRNGDRLINLADDLLTLSGFEAGTFSLESDEVDLRVVVARAQEALQPLTVDRRLEVAFDVPGHPVTVLGDAGHLERVVFNLMSNAVKFTDDGGCIRCVLDTRGDDAVLAVSDTGIGIPTSEQGELFNRFFRSSTAQERAIQGTGLGLSIVASIVHAHGGGIAVESAHLAGTTFTVRLPLSDRPAYVDAHSAALPR